MTAEAFEPASRDRLDVLRGQVDDIDQQIMDLVAARTSLTLAVAQEKVARGIATMVPGRHGEVIENYMDAARERGAGVITPQNAISLGETVMAISRDAQDRWRTERDTREAAEKAAERIELEGLAAEAAARIHGGAL